jgi:GNAT superfamily N-acetyltransferase
VVGFATVGPGEDEDAEDPTVGVVGAKYVLSSHWGRGGGRLLMAEAVRLLSSAGSLPGVSEPGDASGAQYGDQTAVQCSGGF